MPDSCYSPVPPDDARRALLREEVGRFRRRESRRVFDATVHVGVLAGPRTGFVLRAQDAPALDAGLRVDLLCALAEDSPPAWRTAWLARPGTPEPHDLDLPWLAAVRSGFAILDRPWDGCYVVTRAGWRDLLSNETRTWTRLRL